MAAIDLNHASQSETQNEILELKYPYGRPVLREDEEDAGYTYQYQRYLQSEMSNTSDMWVTNFGVATREKKKCCRQEARCHL